MDFFNGKNFEKMAKEYNEKYNKSSILSQKDISIQTILQDISEIMVFLNKTGKGNEEFDSLANSLYGEIKLLQAKFGINLPHKNSRLHTYNDCYALSLKILFAIENLQNENNSVDFSSLKKDFFMALICFFE